MKYLRKIYVVLLLLSSCSTSQQLTDLPKDGSNFSQAIQVNSIAEEYQYLRENCENCKFTGQRLIFNQKKPYDVLSVTTKDGKDLEYYFDISSFFGFY